MNRKCFNLKIPQIVSILYAISSVVFVIILDRITLPLVAPDEVPHLFRAASVSEGHIIPKMGSEGFIGGYVDASILEIYTILGSTAEKAAPWLEDVINNIKNVEWSKSSAFAYYPNTGQYGPLLYFPQAIGLKFGRLLGFSFIKSYHFSRLLTAFATLGLSVAAIANSGRACFVLSALLSTPMFLFLATSLSQDGLLIASTALLVAMVSRNRSSGGNAPSRIAWVSGLVIAMARPPYVLLSVLLMRAKKQRSLATWLLSSDGPLIPASIALATVLWLYVSGALNQASVTPDIRINPHEQIQFLITNPAYIAQIISETLRIDYPVRIPHEIVGVLGFLNITLSDFSYKLAEYALIISLLSYVFIKNDEHSILFTFYGISILALTFGAMNCALYLTWTPVGQSVVQGIQGRHLLPLVLAIPLVIPGRAPLHEWSRRHMGRSLDIARIIHQAA